ncbi:hypothetical protein BX600DRAFT_496220, partial [Xylariales sp. PMI_506]
MEGQDSSNTLERSQLQSQSQLHPPEAESQSPSFRCDHPGCTRAFRRREHLNRHARSHEPTRPHKCYLCNKSFARKDVLQRHVLQHNVPSHHEPKKTLLACDTCRRRKVKCDAKDPCSACRASEIPCVRRRSSLQGEVDTSQQAAEGSLFDEEMDEDGELDQMSQERHDEESDAAGLWNVDTHIGVNLREKTQNLSGSNFYGMGTHHEMSNPRMPSSTGLISTSPSTSAASVFRVDSRAQNSASITSSSSITNASSTPEVVMFPLDNTTGASGVSLWSTRSSNADTPNMTSVSTMASDSSPEHEIIKLLSFFHGLWPLLHLPTLNMETADPNLVRTLECLGSWAVQRNASEIILWDMETSKNIAQSFMQSVMSELSLNVTERTISSTSFQSLQALGLIIGCAITGNNATPVLDWAVWCADMCIAYLRQMGVFQGMRKIDQSFDNTDDRWIIEEQFKRLAATFLRIDAYLSLVVNRAPILRWTEMRFTFPAAEDIWRAATPKERRTLLWHEPAGRASTSFRRILRDGLVHTDVVTLPLPKHFFIEDYNLTLCALYGDVWEVVQEARRHDQHTYKSPSRDASEDISVWKVYLLDLRRHLEINYNLEANFYNPGYNPLSPEPSNMESLLTIATTAATLTIYQILQLIMFADLPVLETSKCCEDCEDVGLSTRLSTWAAGPDGRRAIVHAAQLRRIYERESRSNSSDGGNSDG